MFVLYDIIKYTPSNMVRVILKPVTAKKVASNFTMMNDLNLSYFHTFSLRLI